MMVVLLSGYKTDRQSITYIPLYPSASPHPLVACYLELVSTKLFPSSYLINVYRFIMIMGFTNFNITLLLFVIIFCKNIYKYIYTFSYIKMFVNSILLKLCIQNIFKVSIYILYYMENLFILLYKKYFRVKTILLILSLFIQILNFIFTKFLNNFIWIT